MTTQDGNEPKTLKDDLSKVWDVLKSLVFFLGIYLFFLGWVYLYFYFNRFGVSLANIGVDVASYYNYGFFTLLNFQMVLLIIGFFTAVIIIYYKRESFKYSYAALIPLLITLFTISYFITKGNAENKATNILKKRFKLYPIYFDFTSDFLKSMAKDSLELKYVGKPFLNRSFNKGAVKLLSHNNDMQLYLIYENEKNYYVIFNPNPIDTLKYDVELYNIDKKNIHYATRIMSYKN
jgi:hypothetical protein